MPSPRVAIIALSLVGAWGLSGCAGYYTFAGGVATGVGRGSRGVAGAAEFETATFLPQPNRAARSPLGVAIGGRVEVGDGYGQVAPSVGLRVLPALDRVMPFAGAGLRPVSLDIYRDGVGVGLLNPFIDLGVMVLLGDAIVGRGEGHAVAGRVLSLRVVGGYDLRVTSQPNEFFAGVTVGFGRIVGTD